MILQTRTNSNFTVAEIKVKEANLVYADLFKEEMLGLIDGGNEHLLVDFKNVQYVDSTFLGSLVSSLKHAVSHHADIAVINLSKDIQALFGLIRLDKVFNIYPTEEVALNAAKN